MDRLSGPCILTDKRTPDCEAQRVVQAGTWKRDSIGKTEGSGNSVQNCYQGMIDTRRMDLQDTAKLKASTNFFSSTDHHPPPEAAPRQPTSQ